MELTTIEEEQISEQIKQGFRSGRIDNEYGEHETQGIACVCWKLKIEKWEE